MAGRKADEIVLTGQECDYEPPCVREAKEVGTFNNGNSGKNKFEMWYIVDTRYVLLKEFILSFIGSFQSIDLIITHMTC